MSSSEDDLLPSSPLGEQELDVLRFVTENAPATARVTAEVWGQPRGLAKSTVLTVLERLRTKGYLTRAKRHGSFEYAPALAKNVLLRRLIHDFVERVLAGSSSPLVQYLAERRDLTEDELRILEAYAARTEAIEGEKSSEPGGPPPSSSLGDGRRSHGGDE